MLTDKDKEAIAHIASVSKEPHAEMRAEQLITGAKVEICTADSGWIKDLNLNWYESNTYRLVYPKIKPAYRVYRVKEHGITYTRDSIDGIRYNSLTDKSEWISDWIEYDEPKKWPTPLVERIAAIDIKAAEWIVDNWDDLLDDVYVTNDGYSRDSERLIYMFCWKNSPQGSQYWNNIDNKLND